MTKRLQAGDTIVEVLIAIAIIASVLAGAFLVSRSSLKHVRESEEHSQALNLAQGQVERLRAAASEVTDAAALTPHSPFCMDNSGDPVVTTDSDCTVNSLYKLSIVNIDSAQHTYEVTTSWDNTDGETSQVQLVYRVAFKP